MEKYSALNYPRCSPASFAGFAHACNSFVMPHAGMDGKHVIRDVEEILFFSSMHALHVDEVGVGAFSRNAGRSGW